MRTISKKLACFMLMAGLGDNIIAANSAYEFRFTVNEDTYTATTLEEVQNILQSLGDEYGVLTISSERSMTELLALLSRLLPLFRSRATLTDTPLTASTMVRD